MALYGGFSAAREAWRSVAAQHAKIQRDPFKNGRDEVCATPQRSADRTGQGGNPEGRYRPGGGDWSERKEVEQRIAAAR
jgi:hypothetical protein